jgi:alpha-beta hydrolase superfamily lysophospholipase
LIKTGFFHISEQVAKMTRRDFDFHSTADDLALRGYCWEEVDSPSGILVIAHGLGEHARRYEAFATELNQAGYIVFALDHRGHGGSPGPSGLGDFGAGGWNALVLDMVRLIAIARETYPGLGLTLFGHSMGSFASQQLVLDHSALIDALVLSGSAAVDKLFEANAEAIENLQEEGKSAFSPYNALFEPARTDFDWLSRDAAEVDKYIADPLCGFDLLPESGMGMVVEAARLSNPSALDQIRSDLPVLLLAGDMDPVTGQLAFLDVLRERYATAGIARIETLYYEGGRHEMLNEINREEVMGDVTTWLDNTLGNP